MYAQGEGFGKPFFDNGEGGGAKAAPAPKNRAAAEKVPPSKTFRLYTIMTTFLRSRRGGGSGCLGTISAALFPLDG